MKKQVYQQPNIKVHVPSFSLMQIGVGDTSNSGPIESKGAGFMDEDEGDVWGRTWGRDDD